MILARTAMATAGKKKMGNVNASCLIIVVIRYSGADCMRGLSWGSRGGVGGDTRTKADGTEEKVFYRRPRGKIAEWNNVWKLLKLGFQDSEPTEDSMLELEETEPEAANEDENENMQQRV